MHELDHHHENESRYSCSHCEETGIDIESREYCTACELGKRRMNLDRLAEPLRNHPFTNAMWVAHHSAMKTERAIAAAELALLKSKLLQAERRSAQPVVLSDEQINRIAGRNGIYRAMTPDDQTCKSMIKRFVGEILAAKEQANGI